MSAAVDERLTDEVEALEAILMDDVIINKEEDVPKSIEMVIFPSTGDDAEQQFVCVTLEVRLCPGYPDISPEVVLRNSRGLDDELLKNINAQIKVKLNDCLGQPVVFELIELVRDNLTKSNLPSGQCVICLYGFTDGDVFVKTQCYHYFHGQCLANHVIAGEKYHLEEFEKLPNWQQMEVEPYQPTCPVCRAPVTCDVENLKKAPPPVGYATAPPFRLTAELKALQRKMAALLSQQIAKGGVVTIGDSGPPPLTITSPSDNDEASTGSSSSQPVPKESEAPSSEAPGSPRPHVACPRPYRGFNRRARPGRRGHGRGGGR